MRRTGASVGRVAQALSACVLALGLSAGETADPRAALDEARALRSQGRFAEALEKHVWFHENALRDGQALYAERLSIALAAWADLGKEHPPAIERLRAVRERALQAVRDGSDDVAVFHELASIGRYLKDPAPTVEAFRILKDRASPGAERCFDICIGELVRRREYALASPFVADPAARLTRLRAQFGREIDIAQRTRNELLHRWAVRTFSEEVGMLAEILAASGAEVQLPAVRAGAELALGPVEAARLVDAGVARAAGR